MRSNSLTSVVCVFSRSGRVNTMERDWDKSLPKQEGFTEEYVYKLRDTIKQNAGDLNFICVTNEDVKDVQTIKLRHSNGGWLDKLEIFYHRYPGPVLYLDLDVMIVSDIRDMIARLPEFQFAGIRYGGPSPMLDSSVMVFDGTKDWSLLAHCDDLSGYDNKMIFDRLHGNISWLEDTFPRRIVHYSDRRQRNDEESIVVFTRYPRPHQVGWNHKLECRT